MLFSGIEYSVVQGIERRLWKWAATVSGIEISGDGSTRDEAIEKAKRQKSVDFRAQQEQSWFTTARMRAIRCVKVKDGVE